MCRLSGVPRSSRGRRPRPQSEWEISARQAMREVALEFPAYGYRRVLAGMKRRGWQVGERRVRRWMREEGLSRRRKRAWKRTADSSHSLPVHPNLARALTLSAPDQLWAADITYVRLLREFIYAAVILDVFSRRAGGWAVAQVAETLCGKPSIGRLRQVCDRWIYNACSCFALDLDEQVRSGFRYQYSVYQLEYSCHLMFRVGAQMENVFEALIDRSRASLKLPRVKTILGSKQRRKYLPQKGSEPAAVVVENPAYNLTVFKVQANKLTLACCGPRRWCIIRRCCGRGAC